MGHSGVVRCVVEIEHVGMSSVVFVQDAPGAVRQPGPGPGPAPHPAPFHQLRCGDGSAPSDRLHRLPLHFGRVPLGGGNIHTLSGKKSSVY